ncbi:VanZ family protein [Enterococcus faecalis]
MKKEIYVYWLFYLILLCWFGFFDTTLTILSVGINDNRINILPLSNLPLRNGEIDLQFLIYKFVLFIPCGIGLKIYIKEKNFFQHIVMIVSFSFLFEIAGYVLRLGNFDVNNILFYIFGGTFGTLIHSFIHIVLKEKADRAMLIFGIIAFVLSFGFVTMLIVVNSSMYNAIINFF